MTMIKGKTKTGFEFELDPKALDDYEVLELYENVAETGFGAKKLLIKLIGEEGYSRLKEHCRKKDGTISARRIGYEMSDIFNADVSKEAKN